MLRQQQWGRSLGSARAHPVRSTAGDGERGTQGDVDGDGSGERTRGHGSCERTRGLGAAAGGLLLALQECRGGGGRRLARGHGRHGARAAAHQGDHRRRRGRRRVRHGAVDRAADRRGPGRLRAHLGPSLLRRPPRPRRSARSAYGDVPRHHPARRAQPGRTVHRTGRRPGHERSSAGAEPAVHAAHDDRQRAALRRRPRGDDRALPAAHRRVAGRLPRPVVDREPEPHPPLPGHLVRAAAGRRRRVRRRRSGHRGARGEGLRAGEAGAAQAA